MWYYIYIFSFFFFFFKKINHWIFSTHKNLHASFTDPMVDLNKKKRCAKDIYVTCLIIQYNKIKS
jgi:hypothetical protein